MESQDPTGLQGMSRVEEVQHNQLNIRLELGWKLLGIATQSDGDPKAPSQHYLYAIGWNKSGPPAYPPGIPSRDRSL